MDLQILAIPFLSARKAAPIQVHNPGIAVDSEITFHKSNSSTCIDLTIDDLNDEESQLEVSIRQLNEVKNTKESNKGSIFSDARKISNSPLLFPSEISLTEEIFFDNISENESVISISSGTRIPICCSKLNGLSTPRKCMREEDSQRRNCQRKKLKIDDNSSRKEELQFLSHLYTYKRFAALCKIESNRDRALQCLLWVIGCQYNLLPHQFEAVRCVSGVTQLFPSHLLTGKTCEQHAKKLRGKEETDLWTSINKHDDLRVWRDMELKSCKLNTRGRGILLADVMGLGKTVEGVAAAMLRNAIYDARRKTKLPTIIIGPNDAVLKQWKETLILAGIDAIRIHQFKPRKTRYVSNFCYVLLTRYQLQTEVNRVFESAQGGNYTTRSPLFPSCSPNLVNKLKNQYEAAKGKAKNRFRKKNETEADCVTRILHEETRKFGSVSYVFRTVIIDEAHFLKNISAFWGIGAALIGIHSQRVVPMTGTPYNNGPKDMAALMTFIDPSECSAYRDWWEAATSTNSEVAQTVSEWRSKFMIRREKEVLQVQLPTKHVHTLDVSAYPLELDVYQLYEDSFISSLERFVILQEDGSPEARKDILEVFTIMMATMACQRMALIHPVLPGGREVTIQFSPSRRHLLKREERKDKCVCCQVFPSERSDNFKRQKDKEMKKKYAGYGLVGIDEKYHIFNDLDDEECNDSNVQDQCSTKRNREESKYPIEAIKDENICHAANSGCLHYAHQLCIQNLVRDGRKCPRCVDLQQRTKIVPCTNTKGDVADLPHKLYCTNILATPTVEKGFRASAKIEKVLNWFENSVPHGEKAIIMSFFKGGLDLLEGILVEDLHIGCARFDGDINSTLRCKELDRFKNSTNCRVLLATVQSGGTGLNIVEANHVCFLDRWFNPCVHDQAQDRCHRIGQEREVRVVYNDVSMTVDEVMANINSLKSTNASVILADGSMLGSQQKALGYNELSGVIGKKMHQIREERYKHLAESPENMNLPLPPRNKEILLNETGKVNSPKKDSVVSDQGSSCSLSSIFDITSAMHFPNRIFAESDASLAQNTQKLLTSNETIQKVPIIYDIEDSKSVIDILDSDSD